jgi:hypothetical protein
MAHERATVAGQTRTLAEERHREARDIDPDVTDDDGDGQARS